MSCRRSASATPFAFSSVKGCSASALAISKSRYTCRNLYFVHVVDFEVSRLFNPVFDERITQGMFGFGFRKIRSLDDETVFAHVTSQLASKLPVDQM